MVSKSPDAFRTISEVAEDLELPQHVLRFWESRFAQIRPMKRGGGRRYYRPDDVELLKGIKLLLYGEGYTIKGVQRILKEQGARFVISAGRDGLEPVQPASNGDGRVHEDLSETAHESTGNGAVAAPPAEDPPVPSGRPSGLSVDDIETLEQTVAELLECKRILDQVR